MKRIHFLALSLLFLGFSHDLYGGAVKGRILFEGEPPSPESIEVKSDTAVCGSAKVIEKISVGPTGGIANAVVRILGAKGVSEKKEGRLDQVHCEYVPHLQVLPVGSKLTLTSTDPVLHNVHAFYEDGSTAFNIAVPIPGMEVSQTLEKEGTLKLRCDAGHTWMSAYLVVLGEPYYALTDSNGNFTIEGVPNGDYEIEVWHEWLGKHRQALHVDETTPPFILRLKGP